MKLYERNTMLSLTNITQQFGDKMLYEQLNLQVNPGEHVGLIGHNGAGKSTLIKIITGEILPDEGSVMIPKNSHLGYLDQYVEVDESSSLYDFLKSAYQDLSDMEAEITSLYATYSDTMDDKLLTKAGALQTQLDQSDFYQIDTLIEEMAKGLGLDVFGLDTLMGQLSGGQKSKAILAKLLLEKPDILVLDEPTNHLDDTHVQWLTDFLNQFVGTFLVVSHDQDFINDIATHIADIEFGQLTKYTGNLEKALSQKEANREAYLKQYASQQKHIEKTEAYIRKYKAGSRSTMAKSREKQLAKIDRLTPPSKAPSPNFQFPYRGIVSTMALSTTDLLIGYENPLLPPLNLTVANGEKVAIRGFNGIGKSTLLKTLIEEIKPLGGEFHFPEHTLINYFAQDLHWEYPLQTPLQYLSDCYPTATIKELRRQLSRAGLINDLAQEPLHTLSGGEQTKVKLAQMTMKKGNLLILDEPTNHIDQSTKDALAETLDRFEGTVIVVSHEQSFYDPFIDRIIDIAT